MLYGGVLLQNSRTMTATAWILERNATADGPQSNVLYLRKSNLRSREEPLSKYKKKDKTVKKKCVSGLRWSCFAQSATSAARLAEVRESTRERDQQRGSGCEKFSV